MRPQLRTVFAIATGEGDWGMAEGQFEVDESSTLTSPRRVPSVRRAFQILDLLSRNGEAMSLAQISRTLVIAKSTALAISATMVDEGVLARTSQGLYRLGPAVVALGQGYLYQTDILREFELVLTQSDRMREHTVLLSTLDGVDVVYLACRQGVRSGGFDVAVGMRAPAHRSASGKSLLAGLPDADVVARFAEASQSKSAAPTEPADVDRLLIELAEVRRHSYAIDDEGTVAGMVGVGAAIRHESTRLSAAIGVSVIKSTVDDDDIEALGVELVGLARQMASRTHLDCM
jgi:IclR family transcriptional regulator, blcABC operon repressor